MIKADSIYYGGDYNPDQWDDKTIDEDMKYFKKAHINMVILPVFSWAKLEVDEDIYDFTWLDKVIDKIWANGIYVCLATPTAAQPAWLSKRYPEVLPVDRAGRKRTHGMRVFFCVNSLKYRERARKIAEEMAKRYSNHPAVKMWHICNEYGTYCYCETCQAKFRLWLKKKYKTIENLNEKWHTCFWGKTLYSFEEIELPTELNDDYRFNPIVQLEYMRFMTDSTVECLLNEYEIVKKYNPDKPIQTNMSGYIKKIDQFELTKHIDVVAWDNYPWPDHKPAFIAMKHDLMRSLKGGQPFVLAEQSPNQQNWQPYNKLKKPGEVRKLSYQAIAHGADTCFFFQMRQSVAGQEKFHGAIISHSGRDDTRIFKEITKLGEELSLLKDKIIDARTDAKVGILFDWNNWWALELCSGPSKDMNYLDFVSKYYEALFNLNISVEFVNFASDLSKYKLVIAPMVYMMKGNVAANIRKYVKNGGHLIGTTMTGIADEYDRCIYGAYPGPLKDIFGLWVEETDGLRPTDSNKLELVNLNYPNEITCNFLCDIIHPDKDAEIIATYKEDFYKNTPAIVEHNFNKGRTYYIGTKVDQEFLNFYIQTICEKLDLRSEFKYDFGIEITKRSINNHTYFFFINNNQEASNLYLDTIKLQNIITQEIYEGKLTLDPFDAIVCEIINNTKITNL